MFIVLCYNLRDYGNMCASFLEERHDTETRGVMSYVTNVTKHTRQLLNCHLIAVRVKQNKILGHKNTTNIVRVTIVDRYTTIAT